MGEVSRVVADGVIRELKRRARGAAGIFISLDGKTTSDTILAEAREEGRRQALAELLEQKRRRPWIYFIQAGEGGPIKIGIAKDVGRRLASLQTSNHQKLHVVLQFRAETQFSERLMHDRFDLLRLEGEWFAPGPPLLDFISQARTKQAERDRQQQRAVDEATRG